MNTSIRPWRLFLFIVVGLVVLVALFYAEENWRGYHAWQKCKAQMAARGEPTQPEAFIPPRVPDEENFTMTPALAPMFEFFPGTQKWRDTNALQLLSPVTAHYEAAARLVKPEPGNRVNSWVRPRTDLALWAWAFAQGTNRHAKAPEPVLATNVSSKEDATAVLQGLSDFTLLLDELRQASRRPYARFNIRYEEDNPATILLPHLSKLKLLCQVLQLRTSAELSLGHTEDARADLDLSFYLIASTRMEPFVISQLVRMAQSQIALQGLAEGVGQWTEPQLRELQEQLQALDFIADSRHTLQAERSVFGVGLIEFVRRSANKFRSMEMFTGGGEQDDSAALWPMAPLLVAAPSGWMYLEERNYSQMFGDYLLPAIDLTNRVIRPQSVRKAETAIARQTQGAPPVRFLQHRLFSGLMLPGLANVSRKTAWSQTSADTANVACALERYRLAHHHLPDSLEKLTPEFVKTLPHDVITGKSLNYQSKPDGHYVIYSVGWNERDDGGDIKQGKSGSVDLKEGDWVWADDI